MVSFTVHLAVIKHSQFPKPVYSKVKSKAYYCECYKQVLKAETKTLIYNNKNTTLSDSITFSLEWQQPWQGLLPKPWNFPACLFSPVSNSTHDSITISCHIAAAQFLNQKNLRDSLLFHMSQSPPITASSHREVSRKACLFMKHQKFCTTQTFAVHSTHDN
jgi:hypothetical protein